MVGAFCRDVACRVSTTRPPRSAEFEKMMNSVLGQGFALFGLSRQVLPALRLGPVTTSINEKRYVI